VFRRRAEATDGQPEQDAIVLLNFWNQDAEVWLPFPRAGRWEEQIDKADSARAPVDVAQDGQWLPVRVPANYGSVYLR
jgi:hypothetical protein